MLYLLDTNIVVHLIRDSLLAHKLKTEHLIFD